jgi:hypothetical protein
MKTMMEVERPQYSKHFQAVAKYRYMAKVCMLILMIGLADWIAQT